MLILDKRVDLCDERRRKKLAYAVGRRQVEHLDEIGDRDRHPAVAAAPPGLAEVVTPVKGPAYKSSSGPSAPLHGPQYGGMTAEAYHGTRAQSADLGDTSR